MKIVLGRGLETKPYNLSDVVFGNVGCRSMAGASVHYNHRTLFGHDLMRWICWNKRACFLVHSLVDVHIIRKNTRPNHKVAMVFVHVVVEIYTHEHIEPTLVHMPKVHPHVPVEIEALLDNDGVGLCWSEPANPG